MTNSQSGWQTKLYSAVNILHVISRNLKELVTTFCVNLPLYKTTFKKEETRSRKSQSSKTGKNQRDNDKPWKSKDGHKLLAINIKLYLTKASQDSKLRPMLGSDSAFSHMSRIECLWRRTKDFSHLHSIWLMWSTACELAFSPFKRNFSSIGMSFWFAEKWEMDVWRLVICGIKVIKEVVLCMSQIRSQEVNETRKL